MSLSQPALMIVYTAAAGSCLLFGGLLASVARIRPRWLETEFRHSVIAFGGGVLIAAVAFVLVPEGIEYVASPIAACVTLLAGGLAFFGVERFLGARKREKPLFSAMLLDYLPESMALGGMFALGAESALLLAVLIGLQNFPEGFNAYRELNAASKMRSRRTLALMAGLIPAGPVFGILGWQYGAGHPEFLGAVMLFAAGGILYLIFQDIAPQARLERHWAPTLGAVAGFAVGMLGDLYV
jgi:ZIP family zinc transporter